MVDEDSSADGAPLNRLLPAPRLIGAIRLAFDLRKLIIAVVGLIFIHVGWSTLDRLFPGSDPVTPNIFGTGGPSGIVPLPATQAEIWARLANYQSWITEPIRSLSTPLYAMVELGRGWARMLHALLSLLWAIIVWGVCGGAIARIAIVQVAQKRQPGVGEAVRFSLRSAGPLITAPLCPLLGLGFCTVIVAAFGLLYRLPVVGFTVAGIVLFIPLAVGLVMTLFVAGLVAGWPLMIAAIASGAEGPLDAWSRTFSYLNQRIGTFVALLPFVWLQGIVGLILVDLFAEVMIRMTLWGLALTAGDAQTAVLFGTSDLAAVAIAMGNRPGWLGAVALFGKSWTYSYFWTAAALIYLWLRHDVDGTPSSECDPPGAMAASTPSGLTPRPSVR